MNTSTRGSIAIPLSLILFGIALAVAGFVAVQLLHKDINPLTLQKRLRSTPSPTVTYDYLSPQLTIDPAFSAQEEELKKNLVSPLRQYYATRTERLGNISIEQIHSDKHTSRVTFDLMLGGANKTISFYYDQVEDHNKLIFPQWNPGMLDNTTE